MFGNLFNQSKKNPEEQLPQQSAYGNMQQAQQLNYSQPGNSANLGAGVPSIVPQSDAGGSKMNPAFRQNLSALSHLDQRTTQVLQHAQEETKRIHQPFIEPDQLLIGLLYDTDIFKLLEEFSVDPSKLTREVQAKEQPGSFTGQPTLSDKSRQVFEQAFRDAKGRESAFISPEDILLALFSDSLTTSNHLQMQGVKKEQVQDKLTKTHGAAYGKKSVLDRYGIDLTQQAREGKLDPIAGRDKEIDRLIHILLRRTKNNPIIIGEAGVGKTAIIEGLAQSIVLGSAPKELQNKRIIQLDLSSIVAGASHRGEFEERLRSVIQETMASSGQIILFIDEIHILMGAGGDGGESMNASNIIKPHLARGQLQIIGATTTTEYRKNFEKDKALERRFQPVLAEEPSEEAAIEMLKVLKPKYEKFHGVTISDATIEAAVKLSKKYIGERYLPDKAVDLLDEAAAWVKLGRSETHLPRIGGGKTNAPQELVEVIKTTDTTTPVQTPNKDTNATNEQSPETLAPGALPTASNQAQGFTQVDQQVPGEHPTADFAQPTL